MINSHALKNVTCLCSTVSLSILAACLFSSQAAALPVPSSISGFAAGSGSIGYQTGSNPVETITQTTPRAVINWNSFNINQTETVKFVQPNSASVALNLISGPVSTISGPVAANGQVWLINPNGFNIGGPIGTPGGFFTAGLVLSTAGISNPLTTGFYTNTTGKYAFNVAGNPSGQILDASAFYRTSGGYLIMQAPSIMVENSNLVTDGGKIQIAAGQTFTADFNGDGLINYTINMAATQPPANGFPTSTITILNNVFSTFNPTTYKDQGTYVTAKVDQDAVLDHVINLGDNVYNDGGVVSGHYGSVPTGSNVFLDNITTRADVIQ